MPRRIFRESSLTTSAMPILNESREEVRRAAYAGKSSKVHFTSPEAHCRHSSTFGYLHCSHRHGIARLVAEYSPRALLRAPVSDVLDQICSCVLISQRSENLPGASANAFLEIMALRIGKPGALFLWVSSLVAFYP